jgi:K+-sensing histidine kinase KdpD
LLYQFLVQNREKILARTRRKTDHVSPAAPAEASRGIPEFFDYLQRELERAAKGLPKAPDVREIKRRAYSVSQVAQGYGVLVQAITDLAKAEASPINAEDLVMLNVVLDEAVADAVASFGARAASRPLSGNDCAQKMGALAHELRNALAAATIAQMMIKQGFVGVGGRTHEILDRNLERMRDILDRSFSEVRLQSEAEAGRSRVGLLDIAEDVEATAGHEARSKGMSLVLEVDPELHVVADPHYLVSALSNLVQNAIKYSRKGGLILIRSAERGGNVCLEVEDQCGGLPEGKAEELFMPFTQKSADRTGLGLGLTISRKAVEKIGGTLAVRDLPGKGCVFTISLPKTA